MVFQQQQQQQQQQHSLLSQTSWSRLEMKPKRDEKHGHVKGHRKWCLNSQNGICREL
jgi:hypothetical protein